MKEQKANISPWLLVGVWLLCFILDAVAWLLFILFPPHVPQEVLWLAMSFFNVVLFGIPVLKHKTMCATLNAQVKKRNLFNVTTFHTFFAALGVVVVSIIATYLAFYALSFSINIPGCDQAIIAKEDPFSQHEISYELSDNVPKECYVSFFGFRLH